MRNEHDPRADAQLDALLSDALPELPPEDVAQTVSPWRRASRRLLWGLGLCTITLNFWNLNYLLPFVGGLLLLTATRALRRENGGFRAMFVMQIARILVQIAVLVLSATRAGAQWLRGDVGTIASGLGVALVFAQLCALRAGLRGLCRKAGLPENARGAGALIVWYAIVCALALLQYNGWILMIALLIAYGCILRALVRLSRMLEEAGYAAQPAPMRVPDWALMSAVAAAVTVAIALGLAFGQRYAMDWSPEKTQTQQEDTRAALLALGFPEDVLRDLTDEEVALCAGADRVETESATHPLNNGREVRTEHGNSITYSTVYDVNELRITAVAVHLPDERESWRVYHHFAWSDDLAAPGTECIQFRPTMTTGEGWAQSGEVTGRLLCEMEGRTMTADFARAGFRTYTHGSIFWDSQTQSAYFAEFSLPRGAQNRRGYVACTLQVLTPGYILDSWVVYTHQKSLLQYPVESAFTHQTTQGWSSTGAFPTVMDALQFYPYED